MIITVQFNSRFEKKEDEPFFLGDKNKKFIYVGEKVHCYSFKGLKDCNDYKLRRSFY